MQSKLINKMTLFKKERQFHLSRPREGSELDPHQRIVLTLNFRENRVRTCTYI